MTMSGVNCARDGTVKMCGGGLVADMPIELPTKFPAGVDIKVSAISNQAGALCSILVRGWLETL